MASPPGVPDFKIFMADIPTRKHVPNSAKALWAECLDRAFHNFLNHGDELAWRELLMTATCILQASSARGGKNNKAIEGEVRSSAKRWLAGERATLRHCGKQLAARGRRGTKHKASRAHH